ncbi:DUF2530 domain-containing protein [Antrihabitans cavernicola]|uniref:DUF2530 domain-containing protein n=1 Tax=Antrihabitans cavernicola TaxID=2495913 RepID=A0A5A7S9M6_9NOCA|nr:DUF2530 domain-containing protein [Spelaeibacter cavernicola]KAA0021283.1 DUF2530 domain-containing protein [Spelaeibacter cavernicola]
MPEIPARFTDPRPVLMIGTVLFVIATVVVLLAGDRWNDALPTCYTGIAIGVLGYSIFWIQRGAARRGSKGAQQGLT